MVGRAGQCACPLPVQSYLVDGLRQLFAVISICSAFVYLFLSRVVCCDVRGVSEGGGADTLKCKTGFDIFANVLLVFLLSHNERRNTY